MELVLPRKVDAPFTMASFNVLGASHTNGGAQHPTWPSGTARVPGMIGYLNAHDVGVVALQEFQRPQLAAFRDAQTGYALLNIDDNAIAWRANEFNLIDQTRVTIPYFGGRERHMPAVELEQRASGERFWVISIHNPATTKDWPDSAKHRVEAVRRELALVSKLRESGNPVFLVGDFNERESARAAVLGAGLVSAAPLSGRQEIDWIFGSGPMTLSSHVADREPIATRTSDHPIITARVQL